MILNDDNLNFLTMHETYKISESINVHISGHKLNLYPTEKIVDIYIKFESSLSCNNFKEFINRTDYIKLLTASDGVKYFNDDELNNCKVSIVRNQLKLGKNKLKSMFELEGNYIFIIDKDENLFITEKINTELGRIHHSSLSRGEDVLAAGMIDVQYLVNEDKSTTAMYTITNCSGHYTPSPDSLEHCISWFDKNKIGYEITEDVTDSINNVKRRKIIFKVNQTSKKTKLNKEKDAVINFLSKSGILNFICCFEIRY